MALKSSELFGCCNKSNSFAISNKDSTLAWGYKDDTIFTVINVNIGCNIKNKILAFFTVLNIILLLFNRIYLFNLK